MTEPLRQAMPVVLLLHCSLEVVPVLVLVDW